MNDRAATVASACAAAALVLFGAANPGGRCLPDNATAVTAEEAGLPKRRRRRAQAALADLGEGAARWRLWWTLGSNDIAQRYRRSAIGQFWITASMAVFIGAIAAVYSALFGMNMREYAPFLVTNIVVWTFLAAILSDGCTVFIQSETYLKQERLPKTLFIFRVLVRNLIILAHNAVLIPLVYLLTGATVDWMAIPMALVGLSIVISNAFLVSLFLGMICARFRDLPQVVANLVQVGFFITPVLWRPEQVTDSMPWLLYANPFANHLALIADPLHGAAAPAYAYWYCLIMTACLLAVVGVFFVRFRERIVYWL
jgi:ABC-type polysaccharide/polyol phosphate export permease